MIIGLTGYSCSGKSYLAHILKKQYNSYIIDCDQVAHEVLNIKHREIIDVFGPIVLLGQGLVSRRALASIVFNDPEKLAILESIQFPAIEERVKQLIAENEQQYSHIVIDAPTLSKATGIKSLCDITIIAKSPLLVRLFRAKRRDRISIFEILARFKNNKIESSSLVKPFVIYTFMHNINNQIAKMLI
jgi:dephospho-CoA kinase